MTKEEIAALSLEQKKELLEMLNESLQEPTPEQLQGGVGDGKSIEDIAKKHNVSVEQISAQLKKGIEVEMEHTSDPAKAEEIAKDHLTERPDYYVQLEKMEQKPISTEELTKRFDDFGKQLDDRLDARFSEMFNQFQEAMKKTTAEIARLNNENAELRRRQPTGIPIPTPETRAFQTPQEQKTKEVADGYFKGNRAY